MTQGDLFLGVCGTLKTTSNSDVDLTVSTSTEATGQIPTEFECRTCGIVQPSINFETHHTERKTRCKSCKSGHSRVIKKLRLENPLPPDEYCCPLCLKDIKELSKFGQRYMSSWVLDHCHDTNTFRGWLCKNCNMGLGMFKDSKDYLERAITYLKKHGDKHGL